MSPSPTARTSPTHRTTRRLASTAGLAAGALLVAGLSTMSLTAAVPTPAVAAAAPGPITVTDTFDGTTLDPRWSVINSDATKRSVSGGALRLQAPSGDTYQNQNNARNLVMLDVPAGDFTATTTVAAPVSKTFQGAGLIAWKDWGNYVRSGLTFVGTGLSPSGIGLENDVETNGVFSAVKITDRPGAQRMTIRLERVGRTLITSYANADGSFTEASRTDVAFDITQVGMYALGATDGTELPAVFEDITINHAAPTTSSNVLDIDGGATGVDVNKDMFGIFYEDINYAADGGLYAELVRNRSFEFSTADNGGFNALTAWSPVGGAQLSPVSDPALALDPATNRTHLRLTTTGAGQGLRNASYNKGFALEQGASYDGSLWARSATPQTLAVSLEGPGGAVVGTAPVAISGDTWTKYPFTLTSSTTTDSGRLSVVSGAASVIGLDMVSLMPADRWVGPVNGKSDLRPDLAEKIADMDPGFVRFPGGCVTNVGDSFATYAASGERRRTYQWKETIGPVEKRPTNFNFWGYNQSYGLGYQEYFDFAEDLGAEPLPVVSVGANGCGGRADREMKVGDANFARWVQDTVDLVEFANGPATSGWGKVRADLGHPEPYGLEYLGLGNEENTTTFEANFPAFRDAVEAKFPDIKIISNSGPAPDGGRFDTLWRFNKAQAVDLVDEHYYVSPDFLRANNRRYDNYPRTGPKVFLGEYASRYNGDNSDPSNSNFANGLSEAAYMTALQRNADVVQLASYAPLLANEDYLQWNPDAIWFDNDESWARPSWHVQSMFGEEPGTETVPSTLSAPTANPTTPVQGGVLLSSWNTAVDYDNVKVTDNASGTTVFSDDFADASRWSPQRGTWAATNGVYRQSAANVTDARSIVTGAYTSTMKDYTLELDATKRSGAEGFLVGFGVQGAGDYYWYNAGGFNNTSSVLQRAVAGGPAQTVAAPAVGSGVGTIATGTTYKVKIVVRGSAVEIYLDGVKQIGYDSAAASETLYQVVTRDAATGEITAKVVNNSPVPAATRIRTSDVTLAPTAEVTTLAGDPNNTNSKAEKDTIAPVRSTVGGVSGDFTYTFEPWSVTFVTMKPATAPAPAATTTRGAVSDPVLGLADTTTVSVRASGPDGRQVPGSVVVTSQGRALGTIQLVNGRGTLAVPASALGDGAHVLDLAYPARTPYAASRAAVTVTVTGGSTPPVVTPPVVTPPVVTPPVVTPPAPVVTVSAPGRARAGSRPVVSLAVSSAPAGARATVTVTRKVVTVVKGKKKRKTRTVLVTQVPVVDGVASLALPRLKPGKNVVTTTYVSTAGVTTTDSTVIRVKARKARR